MNAHALSDAVAKTRQRELRWEAERHHLARFARTPIYDVQTGHARVVAATVRWVSGALHAVSVDGAHAVGEKR